jgi:predicted RNA-binding Zn-ribbon protein involved in translation (DUF1610 family)
VKKCKECNAEMDGGSLVCPRCGHLHPSTCPRCFADIYKYPCESCDYPAQDSRAKEREQKP